MRYPSPESTTLPNELASSIISDAATVAKRAVNINSASVSRLFRLSAAADESDSGTILSFIELLAPGGDIPGDYNFDGTVDAADYLMGRKTRINGPTGYDIWRTHFGDPAASGSGGTANTNVLKPATLVLLMLAAAGWYLQRGRIA
jgi:hypothetical protein